jgi:hypothetical protein
LWGGPIRWYLPDPRPAEVHRWLATQRVRAIAEVPIDTGASEYEALLHAAVHHQRMVNGVSGFAPPGRNALAALYHATPIADAFVDTLRESGVELLVVHADPLGERAPAVRDWLRRELDRGSLSFVRRFHTPVEGDWVFLISGRSAEGGGQKTRPPELEDFLAGKPTCGSGTMGALDFPPARIRFDRGQAIFSGWAMSKHGIRFVDLWFDNRTERHRATLVRDPAVDPRCPGPPHLSRTRYVAVFDRRPAGIRRETDVQVEVTDGRGGKTVFDNRWITWD